MRWQVHSVPCDAVDRIGNCVLEEQAGSLCRIDDGRAAMEARRAMAEKDGYEDGW